MEQRLLDFINRTNWILMAGLAVCGLLLDEALVSMGLISGGLIATVNFHLLSKTLKKALTPPHLASHNVVIAKYYFRFLVSGVIIFFLIVTHFVNPVGLVLGLSVVVSSIMLATVVEIKKMICKEAV